MVKEFRERFGKNPDFAGSKSARGGKGGRGGGGGGDGDGVR